AAPEGSSACYGLNGSCIYSASEVATCAIGTHKQDLTGEGLVDLGGNVAEWVSDQLAKPASDGPPWRMLRGGSFLDEAAGLAATADRPVPPVTAHVSIRFRCAKDAPAAKRCARARG